VFDSKPRQVKDATLSEVEIRQEHEIIEQARTKPEAFRPLYDRYHPVIFRYVFNKLREKEQTADLVAQVFLKALLHLHKYNHQGLPFSAWLYRIAKSEVGQYYRDTKKLPVVVIDEGFYAELAEQGEDFNLEYRKERLQAAMQRLTLEEVSLLDLRFQEGKPFKEIGLILNMTENYAKVKTYRILEKLRLLLKKKKPDQKPGLALGSRLSGFFF
jgi:RNA polymerase sigma-70 factor, ECF subfamily